MLPDYGDNGLLRVVQTAHAAVGVTAANSVPHTELYETLRSARSVVFVLLDGVGMHQLRRHAPGGLLSAHLYAELSSVFPSTTASSVTSWMTGVSPSEHAVTGWHIRLSGSGRVAAPLPFRDRASGKSLESLGIEAGDVFVRNSAFARCLAKVSVLQPSYLVDTTYTRFHAGDARVHGFDGLSDMTERALGLLEFEQPDLLYMYWPEFDALSHRYGADSETAGSELKRIDLILENFFERAALLDAAVIVTADHGFIDVPEDRCLWLDQHPLLHDMLRAPLCGEPRTVYCYVKPDRLSDFCAYIDERLGFACSRHDSGSFIEQGWFGPGRCDALHERIGDQVLVMRDNYMLRDRIEDERPHKMIGTHGGSSEQEMRIPLVLKAPKGGT